MLFFYSYSTDILLIMMSSDMRYTMVGQIVWVIIVGPLFGQRYFVKKKYVAYTKALLSIILHFVTNYK
jgi:hypothetical protein